MFPLFSNNSFCHGGAFGDRRLNVVGDQLFKKIVESGKLIVKRLASSRSEQVQFERFLWNPRTQVRCMIDSAQHDLARNAQGVEHVLAIQDTTEFNFDHRKHELKGLGVVKNNKAVGFFAHPVLAVDAKDSFVLGLAYCKFWSWDPRRSKKTRYETDCQDIKEKESFRWIESAHEAKKPLTNAKLVTFISDRESDIYAFYNDIPDHKTHLLIRNRQDRLTLVGDEKVKLSKTMGKIPFIGMRAVEIPYRSKINNKKDQSVEQKCGTRSNGRSARIAELCIRYSHVNLLRPHSPGVKSYPEQIQLNCVEVVEETNTTTPKAEKIHWRLLTTHTIHSQEDAWQIVDWYRKRWFIEQLFRTSKRGGYEVEKIDCIKPDAIEKLCLLGLLASVKTLQLTLCRDGTIIRPIHLVFNETEVKVLELLNKKLEGKTKQQKNPHKSKTVAWAHWVLGRLGGWMGYLSAGPAGPIAIKLGIDRLQKYLDGYLLFNDVCIT